MAGELLQSFIKDFGIKISKSSVIMTEFHVKKKKKYRRSRMSDRNDECIVIGLNENKVRCDYKTFSHSLGYYSETGDFISFCDNQWLFYRTITFSLHLLSG